MKYRNRKILTVDGAFDSQKELARWKELRLLERAGEISELRRQVVYELAPSVVIQGRRRPPMRYVADFCYQEDGADVVEDVKGYRTRTYMLKRHLMRSVHGIAIRET